MYFPTANEPVIVLHVLGCKGLGGEKGNSYHPVPTAGASSAGCLHPCACLAGPAWAPGAVRGQSRCPHLPARPCGNPRARPRPGTASGTENKAGASPPHRPEQTSSLDYLPFFQGGFPWGQAKQKNPWGWPWALGRRCPPHLPGGAAASEEPSYKMGDAVHHHPPPLALDPFGRHTSALVPLALGQSCWRG